MWRVLLKKFPLYAVIAIFILGYPYPVSAGAGAKLAQSENDVRTYVDRFYTWYAPISEKRGNHDALLLALREKSVSFDGKLSKLLSDDVAAQQKAVGEIVGLDFDPFLYSQDSSGIYRAGRINWQQDRFLISIDHCNSVNKCRPTGVRALVGRMNSRFVFENFLYPEGRNLIETLIELRKGRASR